MVIRVLLCAILVLNLCGMSFSEEPIKTPLPWHAVLWRAAILPGRGHWYLAKMAEIF
jgi:hypothetical protein